MAGEILKKRREELGLDIHEMADLLKIKTDYLRAIENDSFEKLPVPVYTMGYIRCYAGYLSVDADPLIQYYTKHVSQPESATIIPVGFSQKKSPKIFYIIPLVLATAVFIFFYRQRTQPVTPAHAPGAVVSKTPAPAVPDVPVQKPAAPADISPSVLVKNHSLAITASAKTWLSVKFSDGKTEELLLQPGESRNWEFPEKAYLKIGNAGGIRLKLDGRDIGVPGSPGQVMTVALPGQ